MVCIFRCNIQVHAHKFLGLQPYSVKIYKPLFRPSKVAIGTGDESDFGKQLLFHTRKKNWNVLFRSFLC